jgi:hypothetical protein
MPQRAASRVMAVSRQRPRDYCGAVASESFFFNSTPTSIPDKTAARAADNMAFMS